MKSSFLIKNNNKKLIIFFAGALASPSCYEFLSSKEYDVFMLYDYKDVSFSYELLPELSNYEKTLLLAHSMGVMVASILGLEADFKIAINGTPAGCDRLLGLHPGLFLKTLKNFSLDDFKARMFEDKLYKSKDFFFRSKPCEELLSLYELATFKKGLSLQGLKLFEKRAKGSELFKNESFDTLFWDKVISSKKDLVFPPKALDLTFKKERIVKIDAAHFVFFKFNFWDEICIM